MLPQKLHQEKAQLCRGKKAKPSVCWMKVKENFALYKISEGKYE